jgi:uncharacterized protein (TIGR00369 family)
VLDLGERPSGFQDLLGYRFTQWSEGHAVVELEIGPQHLNRVGALHGGVIGTLLDTVMCFAATWCPYPGRRRTTVTLSLTTSFTGAATSGVVRAVGRKSGGGRRIYACTGEVLGPDGTVLAVGQGTFRYSPGSEVPEGVPLSD